MEVRWEIGGSAVGVRWKSDGSTVGVRWEYGGCTVEVRWEYGKVRWGRGGYGWVRNSTVWDVRSGRVFFKWWGEEGGYGRLREVTAEAG